MFWDNVKNELKKYGEVSDWNDGYMSMGKHDFICGLRLTTEKGNDISVVSHKYSYGGDMDLFEIMPSVDDQNDVDGYLTEEEAIKNINILGSQL